MLCDRCGQREATHHDLVVTGGQVRETHLCESCAQAVAGGAAKPPATLGDWLTNFVLTPPPGAPEAPGTPGASPKAPTGGSLRCDGCGMTFADLKKTGLIGCERCYSAFEARLVPLLQRAHEGGARHNGKTPRRGGLGAERLAAPVSAIADPAAVAAEIESLRRELAEAVASEEYERAAEIRDRLEELNSKQSGGGEP